MNLIVLFATILVGSYLFLFEPDSDFVKYMIAAAPLGWVSLFAIRMFKQKKDNPKEKINTHIKDLVIDPDKIKETKSDN